MSQITSGEYKYSRRILNSKVEKCYADGVLNEQEHYSRKNRDAATWNRPITRAFFENKVLDFLVIWIGLDVLTYSRVNMAIKDIVHCASRASQHKRSN